MLELRGISKKFGKKEVLSDCTATLSPGIYGLLGPNGAGKTTLIRCLAGLYQPKAGEILFRGRSIRHNRDYQKNLGYLPQKFGAFRELTVAEVLFYFANLKGMEEREAAPKIEEALSLTHLTQQSDNRVSTLSGGMVRRLGIAQALLNQPEILLLDEPTAGLDPQERMQFKNTLRSLKKRECVVILSTHIVEDVEANCDTVIVMDIGRFCMQDSCAALARRAQGRIYEVPKPQEGEIQGDYTVEREFDRDGVEFLRVCATEPQRWPSVPPTVEDGYLCVLKSR